MASSLVWTSAHDPRNAIKTAREMKMHGPSAACGTCAMEGKTATRDTTSVLKDQGQKHSKATCVMRVSQYVFRCRATSLNMKAK
jgi:hypothetical protein